MNLRSISFDLMDLYQEMEQAFSDTQKRSTLLCPTGCGYCCKTPTVEATVMEMIPMAISLMEQGIAEDVYERIQNENPQTCILYEDHGGKQGRCTQYATRPSLCRLFGVAGVYSKNHEITLSICKELKAHYPERLPLDPQSLNPSMMSEWSSRLYALHPELSKESQPISISLGKALEKVMLYTRLNESN
jgi:uncharacterized protein